MTVIKETRSDLSFKKFIPDSFTPMPRITNNEYDHITLLKKSNLHSTHHPETEDRSGRRTIFIFSLLTRLLYELT